MTNSSIARRSSALAFGSVLGLAALIAVPANAQPDIVGSWSTSDGEIISVEHCGGGFCATVASGPYSGAAVARVAGAGPEFEGRVHDPRNGKSYPGSLTLDGERMALKGCIMEVFCKTVQYWQRAG
ncbi:hypothetical protein FP2506_07146 [Fulvimarina pelagi HTCC2506]|uniref:DUF2147 domain-containing protein n=1 Tax=Fulvimarina pelagi HTCC2506 TaxID=314231 RepID=Q0G6W7_9HYPH|nr:DUF2147 domain-containing protein [Fulvimarina pelagi]EAU42597.1 hypothetical protein FP2506_07146 [Fulvimarina pelagi HTCC2506]